jgi:hypothetical protein
MIQLRDTIICIHDQRLKKDRLGCPLIKGESYQVLGLKACFCGDVFVDVGLILDPNRFEISCGCRRIVGGGIWWFDARRFGTQSVITNYETKNIAFVSLN